MVRFFPFSLSPAMSPPPNNELPPLPPLRRSMLLPGGSVDASLAPFTPPLRSPPLPVRWRSLCLLARRHSPPALPPSPCPAAALPPSPCPAPLPGCHFPTHLPDGHCLAHLLGTGGKRREQAPPCATQDSSPDAQAGVAMAPAAADRPSPLIKMRQ
jgi:hypothetical protein